MSYSDSSQPDFSEKVLLDVQTVASMLDCSARHVYRLADAGRMPPPVRLGALVRWHRATLDEWLSGGCRPVRTAASQSSSPVGTTKPKGGR